MIDKKIKTADIMNTLEHIIRYYKKQVKNRTISKPQVLNILCCILNIKRENNYSKLNCKLTSISLLEIEIKNTN